jgi:26S proteasome non-ATPase regulatory subunit 9
MNTRLITPDGFPRADLDVAQSMCKPARGICALFSNNLAVRTTRSRIIYLRNDYKDLMNVIEKHIHEYFARQAENGTADEPMTTIGPSTSTAPSSSSPASSLPLGPAFAKVNSVVAGSPAESAGLKVGDEIRNFGYVNNTNHDGLKRVGECVQGNEGVSLEYLWSWTGR